MAMIKIKTDRMQQLTELHGLSNAKAAEKIGISKQTFLRALEGESVSARFVAGACLGFGIPFDSLFETQHETIAA